MWLKELVKAAICWLRIIRKSDQDKDFVTSSIYLIIFMNNRNGSQAAIGNSISLMAASARKAAIRLA